MQKAKDSARASAKASGQAVRYSLPHPRLPRHRRSLPLTVLSASSGETLNLSVFFRAVPQFVEDGEDEVLGDNPADLVGRKIKARVSAPRFGHLSKPSSHFQVLLDSSLRLSWPAAGVLAGR